MPAPTVTTPPTDELPVSMERIKEQLRLEPDYTAEDERIKRIARGTVQWAEKRIRRRLATQTQRIELRCWPTDGRRTIALPYGPVQSIESVEYTLEGASSASTFAASNYKLDASGSLARLELIRTASWPSETLEVGAPIAIAYVSGYDPLPDDIVDALMLRIGSLYNNAADEVIGIGAVVLRTQNNAENLLDIYREVG